MDELRSIEELLETYAPAGAAMRRRAERHAQKRIVACYLIAGFCTCTLTTAAYLQSPDQFDLAYHYVTTWLEPELTPAGGSAKNVTAQLDTTRQHHSGLETEIQGIKDQRDALDHQKRLLASQQADINAEIDVLIQKSETLQALRETLGEKQRQYSGQQQALRNALSSSRQQQAELRETYADIKSQRVQLEVALNEITQQRDLLNDNRLRFKAQRKLLEHESSRLLARRSALEDQKGELELQWRELQSLLQQVSAAQELLDQSSDGNAVLYAGRIDNAELGKTRGGIDIGGKLDIAIGLTRTVDINGIEQYSSHMDLSNLNGLESTQLSSVEAVVIQNGVGNTISTEALSNVTTIPVFIQNTLDDQHIVNSNVLDVRIGNTASHAAGITAGQAITDSISFQR